MQVNNSALCCAKLTLTEHPTMKISCDFLVLGSGIAGLSFALKAAGHGTVAVVTKREVTESATNYAQGGIASVFSQEDTFAAHIDGTLVAGAGICHEEVVRMVIEEGPPTIKSLIDWGVKFTTSGDSFDLTREGGHSQRRILHADDVTGREIERALVAAVRNHPARAEWPGGHRSAGSFPVGSRHV